MGNTRGRRSGPLLHAVHPHTHGEHIRYHKFCRVHSGSSPHAWGTLTPEQKALRRYRFIPTRMGNTFWLQQTRIISSVHPHTHGEHTPIRTMPLISIGSSPHAWGTPRGTKIYDVSNRFIPTRMGNTIARYNFKYFSTVHPHTHGEHITIFAIMRR